MGVKGKHSPADLAVIRAKQARLEPPADLTPAQRERWLAMTESSPPDMFRPADTALLRMYCVAEALSMEAAASIARDGMVIEVDGRKRANPALQSLVAASTILNNCAAKLRLCPSSRYDAAKAARKGAAVPMAKRPWEDDAAA